MAKKSMLMRELKRSKLIEKYKKRRNELKESIRLVQNDHLSFVKIITILKEKAETLDYIMSQITDLKQRYNKIFGEDEKFLNKLSPQKKKNY